MHFNLYIFVYICVLTQHGRFGLRSINFLHQSLNRPVFLMRTPSGYYCIFLL